MLSYPGVAFSFQIPPSVKTNDSHELMTYLSKASSPPCHAMALFKGNNWSQVNKTLFTADLPFEESSPAINYVDIDEKKGTCVIHFGYHAKSEEKFTIVLNNTTMQDIIMALGAPSERFFKEDSRLSIHNPLSSDEKDQATLFFNYFALGMDICFDTSSEWAVAKKIVFHGNIPGSIPFQKYQRCRWRLRDDSDDYEQPTSEKDFSSYSQKYTSNRPMLLNRTLDDMNNSIELVGDTTPVDDEKLSQWALTDLYGSPGLVFEVMKNDSVASLTLY